MTAILVGLLLAAPALELDRLLDEVAARSPEVAVQMSSIDVAARARDLAGAWPDPELSVMAESLPLSSHAAEEEPAMIRYGFAQELRLFGRPGLARSAAAGRLDRERAGLRRVAWDARAQAVALFYELWMNREMERLADQQVQLLGSMRDAALARYRGGMAMGHHDVLRAEAEIETMKVEIASLGEERPAIAAMLNRLRGAAPGAAIGAPSLPARAAIPGLPSLADRPERSPDVEGMLAMRSGMVAERELSRRMRWPMVMVEGSYEQRTGGMPDGFGVALMVRLPLWFWDRQQGEEAMADAMVRRADREVAAMRTMVSAEQRMAWSRARAADRRLTAIEDSAIPRMRETLESAEVAYRAGAGDFLDVLDAAMALRDLEMDRARAIAARETARFELARISGGPLEAR